MRKLFIKYVKKMKINLCKAPKQVRFLIPENQTNGKTLKQTTRNNN